MLVVEFDVRIWWKRASRPLVMLVGRVRYGYIGMSTSPCTMPNIKLSPERSLHFCTISQPRFAIISLALLVQTRGLSPFTSDDIMQSIYHATYMVLNSF